MTDLEDVPLGQPRIRWWELEEDSPAYYKALAAPSDEDLIKMWWILSFVNLIDSIIVAAVFLGIVTSCKARYSIFNLYLCFLMIPDFIYSFLCFVTCILSASKGRYFSSSMCRWQAVYLIYGTTANAWLNAIITRELYRLLEDSNRRVRYFPPGIGKVFFQSGGVYLYSIFISLWVMIDGPWELQTPDAVYGFVCLPVPTTRASHLFWYLFFVPISVLIPLLYITWLVFLIFRRKLLPKNGKRRSLTVYFLRITFIFAISWIPTILSYYLFRGLHPWGMFGLGIYSHISGGVSAVFSTFKPDVGKAVKDFLCCRWIFNTSSSSSMVIDKTIGRYGSGVDGHDRADGNRARSRILTSNRTQFLSWRSTNSSADRIFGFAGQSTRDSFSLAPLTDKNNNKNKNNNQSNDDGSSMFLWDQSFRASRAGSLAPVDEESTFFGTEQPQSSALELTVEPGSALKQVREVDRDDANGEEEGESTTIETFIETKDLTIYGLEETMSDESDDAIPAVIPKPVDPPATYTNDDEVKNYSSTKDAMG